MRLLTTLYVADHRARVAARQQALIVTRSDGTWSRVPVNALEAVVMAGHGQVSSEALALCAEHGIGVTALSSTGRLRFHVGRGTGGNVQLRVAQMKAALDITQSTAIARWIVAGKLANADHLIQRWRWEARGAGKRFMGACSTRVRQRAESLVTSLDGDAIRGCEGEGARVYFHALRQHIRTSSSNLRFESRSRRPPRDPVNAALSYAYGLLTGPIIGALEAIGLDPQIGFLHGIRPGRPALALDLLEEFRPAIADRFIVGQVTRLTLSVADFTVTPGGGVFMSDDGRRKLIAAFDEYRQEEIQHQLLGRRVPRGSLPLIQATLMARYLRGDLPAYPPFVAVQ